MKYRPDFPERFGSIADARGFSGDFFHWYNDEHHHGGLGLLTPADVHHGRGAERLARRDAILAGAFAAHPERFARGRPNAGALPDAVWINRPASPTREVGN